MSAVRLMLCCEGSKSFPRVLLVGQMTDTEQVAMFHLKDWQPRAYLQSVALQSEEAAAFGLMGSAPCVSETAGDHVLAVQT